MSVQVFKEVADAFLRSNDYRVLAIKGSWGVGKTYAWHKLADELGAFMRPATYSYASLFGLSNIADVRKAIIAGMAPAASLGRGMSLAMVNESWFTLLTAKLGKARRALDSALGSSKYGRYVTVGLDTIAPWLIRDMVVCLDDFERAGSGLGHDELMGFISSLKETERCKVILVLNDEKLPAGAENPYKKYREKVIDLELQFSPTIAEAIRWGLPADLPFRGAVADAVEKLQLSNVRILKKIAAVTALLAAHFANVRPEVQREAVVSGAVLCWALYDQTGTTSPIGFLKRWNTYVFMVESQKKKPTEEEEKWVKLLNDAKFVDFDEFDAAILKVVEQGYTQGSGIDAQFAKRSTAYIHGDLGEAFRTAWELFHESLDNNADDVVNAIHARARQAVAILNPSDVSAAVALLRQLNRNDLADDLIDYYIEQRRGDRELFDLGSTPFGNQITDGRMRAAFETEYKTAPATVTLRQAVETMAKERGWSREDSRVVEIATADDFYTLFKGPLDVRRGKAIDACIRHSAQPQSTSGPRVMEALRRIAQEAPINRIRLARIAGLDEPAPADAAPEADTPEGPANAGA